MKKDSLLKKIVSPIVLWNVGGMILFVFIVIVGAWLWIADITRHGDEVTVPDVTGLQARYALEQLQASNLEGIVVDSTYCETIAPGEVLDQQPKAGSMVKSGREIHLTVNNMCAPLLPLPDLADNSSRHQAEMKLRAMGFKVTEPEMTSGDKDWVYGVKCAGRNVVTGQRVPVDAPITLVVGDGSTNPDYEPVDTLATDDSIIDDIINDLF